MELLHNLISPDWILNHGGIWLVILIIFAETGLLVGFFFPGDSLLFVTGMTLSLNDQISGLNIYILPFLIAIAGVLGNVAGYWFGKKSGPLLFKREDSLIFKRKHLTAAHEFYEKRGGAAIIMARFIPFVRTFAPIVAGVVVMDYKKFFLYNVVGSFAWVFSMIFLGYFLGKIVPGLQKHLDLITIGIILLSVLPLIFKYLKGKLAGEAA